MLKAWLVSVGILFVLAEFSIWLKQFMLPLPIYVLGGAFLAIASNYEKGIMTMFRQPEELGTDVLNQTAEVIKEAKIIEENKVKANLPETKQQFNG